MGDFAHPVLVLQGLADTVTDPALAKAFHDVAASEVRCTDD
jgi:alpha-beta hydrolase superfamily lysophospholipase